MWPVDDIFVLPGVITSCFDFRHSLSSYGRRAFAVADPTAWNSLSDDLRDPRLALTVSDVYLKLGCFQSTSTYSHATSLHDFLVTQRIYCAEGQL